MDCITISKMVASRAAAFFIKIDLFVDFHLPKEIKWRVSKFIDHFVVIMYNSLRNLPRSPRDESKENRKTQIKTSKGPGQLYNYARYLSLFHSRPVQYHILSKKSDCLFRWLFRDVEIPEQLNFYSKLTLPKRLYFVLDSDCSRYRKIMVCASKA